MQRGAWRGGGPEKDPSSRRPQEWASVNPELSLGVRLVVPRRASQVLRWWLSDPGAALLQAQHQAWVGQSAE